MVDRHSHVRNILPKINTFITNTFWNQSSKDIIVLNYPKERCSEDSQRDLPYEIPKNSAIFSAENCENRRNFNLQGPLGEQKSHINPFYFCSDFPITTISAAYSDDIFRYVS